MQANAPPPYKLIYNPTATDNPCRDRRPRLSEITRAINDRPYGVIYNRTATDNPCRGRRSIFDSRRPAVSPKYAGCRGRQPLPWVVVIGRGRRLRRPEISVKRMIFSGRSGGRPLRVTHNAAFYCRDRRPRRSAVLRSPFYMQKIPRPRTGALCPEKDADSSSMVFHKHINRLLDFTLLFRRISQKEVIFFPYQWFENRKNLYF